MVSVAFVSVKRTVQHRDHVGVSVAAVEVVDFRQHGTFKEVSTNHEQRQVGMAADDSSIGNNFHRRTVEEDVVVTLFQFSKELVHTLGIKQLRGIRRHDAHRNDIQIGISIFANNLIERALSIEVIGNTIFRTSDKERSCGLTEVKVDDNGFLVLNDHTHGQVHCNKRLS